MAERLKDEIGLNIISLDGLRIKVTVSIGIAFLNPTEVFCSPEKLVEAADKMLYAAKNAGRDRILVDFNPAKTL